MSRYVDRLGFGGVFESDLIYDRSFAPRSFKVNMTLPLQNDEINVLEVGFRQVGLDHQIRKLVGPEGLLNGQNFPEVLSEIMEFWMNENDESSNEIRRASPRHPRSTQHRQTKSHRQQVVQKLQSDDSVEGSLYVTLAGKTIAYLDIADLSNTENDMTQIVKSWKEMIKRSDLETDRSFSFMFLNKKYHSEGKTPASVNGTVILGLKTDRTGIWPSVAVEMSTRTSERKFVQRIASSPAIKFERQSKKITFSLPQERTNLFHVASEVYEIDAEGVEQLRQQETQRKEHCSNTFNRFLGIEVCSKTAVPRKTFEHGLPPFNGLWNLDLEVVKTDRSMSGWEFQLELPEGRKTNFKCAFDTPQSEINRKVSLEAEILNYRGLRIHLDSPRKTVEIKTSYELDTTEVNYKIEALVDRVNKYSFESGVKRTIVGRKTEYIPVFRISSPSIKPISVSGNVVTERGRKAVIKFDLKSENNAQKFLRGNLVKEGSVSMNKDFRLASDVTAELGFISFRIFGAGDKKDTVVSSDLKIEYQTPNSRKHNVKWVAKLQNLSTAVQAKVSSFVEVQSSQFPSKNFHVSWNVVHKNDERLENEVTIMWDGKMSNPTKKIHVLQISKFAGFKSGRTLTSDNIISLEVAPLDFNYDFKASGHMERSKSTPKYKVQFEVNNKKQKDQDYQVTFEYQNLSAQPLKMAIDASLILPSGEIRYSDKIDEIQPKIYRGKTQLQWHQEKKATLDYTLKVRSDTSKIDLELDSDLKAPFMTIGLHHTGLLRVARHHFELESKMNHDRNNVYELKADLNRKAKSTLQLVTRNFQSKIESNQSPQAKTALVDIQGQDWSHYSNLVLANDAVTLSSKTLSEQRPVLTINARKSKRDSTRFTVESSLVDAKFELNPRSSPKTASFEVKQKQGEKVHLKAKTTIRSLYDIEVSCEGKSASVTLRSADLKIKREGDNQAFIEILSKENNREWINSRASYSLRDTFDYEIHVSNRGIEAVWANGKFNRKVVEGPHDVQIKFLRNGAKHECIFHHQINNKQIKTSASHSKDGQLQRIAEITLRGNKLSTHESDFQADMKVKNLRKSLDAHLSHQHNLRKHGVDSTCTGKIVINGEDNYEVKIQSNVEGKQTGKAHIRVECKTPKKNWESQIGEINAEWQREQVKGNLRLQQQQKELIVSAQASKQDKYRVNAEIKSDFKKIPSCSFEGHFDKKTISLNSKLQGKEILKVEGSADYNDWKNFRGELEGKSAYTPRYTVSVDGKKIGKQMTYRLEAAQDGQKVLSAQASHEEHRDQFKNSLRVTCDKKNWDASIESSVNKNFALGPHDVTVNANLPRSGKKTLQVHHELVDGQIKEWAKYFEADQEKTSFSATGNYRRERNIFSIELMTRAKCPTFSSIEHDGLIRLGKDSAECKSKLTVETKKVYEARCTLSRRERSSLFIESNAFRGKLEVSPFAEEKTALLEVSARKYEHKSDARISRREASLNSKTLKNNHEILNINVQVSPKTCDAKVDSEIFNTQVKYDVESSPKTVWFNFDSKKGDQLHLQGKTSIRSFSDIECKVEGKSASYPLRTLNLQLKGQEKQAFVEILAQSNNREYLTCRASYEHSAQTLVYKLDVSKSGEQLAQVGAKVDRRLAQGPHDVQIKFLRNGAKHECIFHHQINNKQIKTSASHSKDGQLQRIAEITLRGNKLSTHESDFQADMKVKNLRKSLDAHLSHQHNLRKHGVDSTCTGKIVINGEDNYEVKIQSNVEGKQTGKAHIRVECKTPKKNWESQIGEINAEWQREQVKGNLRLQQQQKELIVSAQASKQDKYRVNAEIKSDFKKIPSCSFEGHFDKKTISLNSKLQGKEILKVEGSADYNDWKNFRGELEGKSAYTPRYTVSVDGKKIGKQMTYRLEAAQDGQKVLSAQASHEEHRDQFKNSLRVTCDKKNWDASIESSVNKNFALGPHDVTVNANLPRSGKKTLQVHHELVDGQIKEWAKYFEADQEKTSFSATGNYRRERNIFSIELMTRAKCPTFSSIEHDGLIRLGKDSAECKSKLTVETKKVYEARCTLSRRERSSLFIESNAFRGKLEVSPFAEEKTALLEVSARKYEHKSDARISRREASLNSKTLKNNHEILNINVQVSPKTCDAKVDSEIFNTQVKYDVESSPKTVWFNFDSKKGDRLHLQGKTSIRSISDIECRVEGKSASYPRYIVEVNGKKIGHEMQYNVDATQDGQKVLSAQASHQTTPSAYINKVRVSLNKKNMELACDASIDKNIILGPHRVEIRANAPRSHKRSFRFEHELRNGQIKEEAKYWVDEQERSSFTLNGNYKPRQGAYNMESKMMHQNKKVYQANAFVSKREKSYFNIDSEAVRGKLEVTPFGQEKAAFLEFQARDYKHSTEARLGDRDASLKSKTSKGDRQIAFVDAKGNISTVEAEIDSPFFDSRLKYDVSSNAPKHASLDFKSKIGKQFQFNRRVEYAM